MKSTPVYDIFRAIFFTGFDDEKIFFRSDMEKNIFLRLLGPLFKGQIRERADALKGQSLEMFDSLKGRPLEIVDNLKGQPLEMAAF